MRRKNPEREIQIALAAHLARRGVPGLVWWHTPNAPRNAITGSLLKRMGMRAGVSDLILFHNRELFALELKADRGRPTEAQLEFQSDIHNAGGYCAIATGIDSGLACLKAWGLLR